MEADGLADRDAGGRRQRRISGRRVRGRRAARLRRGPRLRRGDAGRIPRLRDAVVLHLGDERDRLAHFHRAARELFDPDERRFVPPDFRTARAGAERARFRRLHDVVDDVVRPERRVGFFGRSVRGERPDQFVFDGEPLGHRHSEHEPIAPRQEMRRLASIEPADVEAVARADGHVDFFFPVPIHVAEQEIPRPVRALLPPFVRGRDVLALGVGQRLGVEVEGRPAKPAAGQRHEQDRGAPTTHCGWPPEVWAGRRGGGTRHSGHPMTTSFLVRCRRSRRRAISS